MPRQPCAGVRHIRQQRVAFAQVGAGGGAEGNHSLAGEIIPRHKLVDRPGGDPPPDGVADTHRVVGFPVLRRDLYQRYLLPGFRMVMLVGDAAACVRPVQVSGGIGSDRLKDKDIRAGFGGDDAGNPLGVAVAE